eukprot:1299640-Alexandrium_andersonii.AAC.1
MNRGAPERGFGAPSLDGSVQAPARRSENSYVEAGVRRPCEPALPARQGPVRALVPDRAPRQSVAIP